MTCCIILYYKLIYKFFLFPGFLLKEFFKDFDKVKRLVCVLDNVFNWKYLLEKLPLCNDVLYYEIYLHGGLNPALLWLESLLSKRAESDLTTEKFKFFLRRLERLDIVDYVEKELESGDESKPAVFNLKQLVYSQKVNLAKHLSKDNNGEVKDWKYVANCYDFPSFEIESIDQKKQIPNKFSPSREILNDVIKTKDMSLSEVWVIVDSTEMKDKLTIYNILKEFVDEQEIKEKNETKNETSDEEMPLVDITITSAAEVPMDSIS